MPTPNLFSTRITVVAAAIEMLSGFALYVFPHQFHGETYGPMTHHFPQLSAALVAGGVVLLVLERYRPRPWVGRVATLLPAGAMMILAASAVGGDRWGGAVVYAGMALTVLLIPWLPAPLLRLDEQQELDPFAMILGLIEAVYALMLLVDPHLLSMPAHAPLQGYTLQAAAAAILGAASLLPRAVRRRPDGRIGLPVRLAGALLPAGMSLVAFQSRTWTDLVLWAVLGLGVLVAEHPRRRPPHEPDASTAFDTFPQTTQPVLEAWTWMLAALVTAITAIGGSLAVASPLRATLFVGVLSAYNALAYRGAAQVGGRSVPMIRHFIVLVLASGILLGDTGTIHDGMLVLLVALVVIGARALGQTGGLHTALLVEAVLVVSAVDHWLHGQPLGAVVSDLLVGGVLVAAVAGVALRFARATLHLLDELRKAHAAVGHQLDEQRLIDQIGRSVRSSLDLDETLGTTVNELGQALRVHRCFIRLTSSNGSAFDGPAITYQHPDLPPLTQGFPAPGPVVALSFRERRIIAVANAAADPLLENLATGSRTDLLQYGIGAMVAAPVIREGAILGVLVFQMFATPREWTPAEIQFIEAVSVQVAVAIIHSRSHRQLEAQRDELEAQHTELEAQRDQLEAQRDELEAQRDQLAAAVQALGASEQALRRSEVQFRTAFHRAPIGLALVGLDLRLLQVNQVFCEMLGYTEDELTRGTAETITHPEDMPTHRAFHRRILAGELDTCQFEKRFVHRCGRSVWAQVSVTGVRDENGRITHLISHIQDITERRRSEQELIHMANFDPLTDLYNRRRFREELERQVLEARRYGHPGALLFLDLDEFKQVNDTLGHQVGDALLMSVARLLEDRLRRTDTVARLGGDEFAIYLPHTGAVLARQVASTVLAAIRQHVEVAGEQSFSVTASIGVAVHPEHGETVEELLAHADVAMYRTKESGRNGVTVFRGTCVH